MALQHSLRPLIVAGDPNVPHTLEAFLESGLYENIKPLISQGGKYQGKVKVIFRLQVPPWHSSSTLTHEAGLALFDNQGDYFHKPTVDLTPRQIRDNLAQLAARVLPAETIEQFRDLLTIKGSPNGGVGVTDDLKYNIKYARQNSIHVSPTVLWDGLVAGDVSSSWGKE